MLTYLQRLVKRIILRSLFFMDRYGRRHLPAEATAGAGFALYCAPFVSGVIALSTVPAVQNQGSDFVRPWERSGSAERGNFQSFAKELCDLLAAPTPTPQRPDDRDNAYVFERTVRFDHGDGSSSTGWIDLYKRGCLVMSELSAFAAFGNRVRF
jgi:hypothetical protein